MVGRSYYRVWGILWDTHKAFLLVEIIHTHQPNCSSPTKILLKNYDKILLKIPLMPGSCMAHPFHRFLAHIKQLGMKAASLGLLKSLQWFRCLCHERQDIWQWANKGWECNWCFLLPNLCHHMCWLLLLTVNVPSGWSCWSTRPISASSEARWEPVCECTWVWTPNGQSRVAVAENMT